MNNLLRKFVSFYQYFFAVLIVLLVVFPLFSKEPFAAALGTLLSYYGTIFGYIFDHTIIVMYEYAISVGTFGGEVYAANNSTATGLFKIGTILLSLVLLASITIYFPLIFVFMPLVVMMSTCDEEKKQRYDLWLVFINPFRMINTVGGSLIDGLQTQADMESNNPVLRQMAINKDLAEQIADEMKK